MRNYPYIVFWCAHIIAWFDLNISNFHTIFCGGFNIIICNRIVCHVLVFSYTEMDATPISGVSRINAKLWHWSREPKIGVASIFVWSHTNKCYVSQLHTKILACLQNMGAQLPLFRIFHPNPCARRTHPKMGCILRAHGFGWQIRVFGSSTSVFLPQLCQMVHVGWAYMLLGEGTVLSKFCKNFYRSHKF